MASYFNNPDFLASLKDAVKSRENELYAKSLLNIRDVIVDDIERHILNNREELQEKLANAIRTSTRSSDYKIDAMSYSVRHWTRTLEQREKQLARAQARGTEEQFFKDENDNLNFLCTNFYIPHNYNGIRRTEVLKKTDALLLLSAKFGPHYWFTHRTGNTQMWTESFVVKEEHVVMHYYPKGISKAKKQMIDSLKPSVEPVTPPCETNVLNEPPEIVRDSSWPWRCHDCRIDYEPSCIDTPVEDY